MRFKPGDKVRVLEDIVENRAIAYAPKMNIYRGEVCTVKEVFEKGSPVYGNEPFYTLCECESTYGYWKFVEEWLEPVEDSVKQVEEKEIIEIFV